MRQQFVVTEAHPKTIAAEQRSDPEELFELGIARAEHHHLRAPGEDAVEGFGNDIAALLWRQPRDDADEGNVASLGEAHLFLKSALAIRLAAQVVGGEGMRDGPIGRGIPEAIVDAVEYDHQ